MKKSIVILGVAVISLASVGMVILNNTSVSKAKAISVNKEEIKEEKTEIPVAEVKPEKEVEEESHSFMEYIEKSFITELQAALLV